MWKLVIHNKSTYFVKGATPWNKRTNEQVTLKLIKENTNPVIETVSTYIYMLCTYIRTYHYETCAIIKLGEHWNTKDQTCHTLKQKNKHIIFSPWHGIHQQAIHKSCLCHSQWGCILCSSDASMPWTCNKGSNNSPTPNFKPMLQRFSRIKPPHLKCEVGWGGSNLLRLTHGTEAVSNLSF